MQKPVVEYALVACSYVALAMTEEHLKLLGNSIVVYRMGHKLSSNQGDKFSEIVALDHH